jgi:hypothetical protein
VALPVDPHIRTLAHSEGRGVGRAQAADLGPGGRVRLVADGDPARGELRRVVPHVPAAAAVAVAVVVVVAITAAAAAATVVVVVVVATSAASAAQAELGGGNGSRAIPRREPSNAAAVEEIITG